MLLLGMLVSLGVADNASLPDAVVLDIGQVRIAPHRPGTNQTWDTVTPKPPRSGSCQKLVQMGATAVGVATAGAGGLLLGVVGSALCSDGSSSGAVQAHPATDPDIYLRLRAGPGVYYRSPTVVDSVSHIFHFRVVVPVAAIRNAGLELAVLADDGTSDEDSMEAIGNVRLGRQQLLDAALDGELLTFTDKASGLELLELEVTPAPPQRRTSVTVDVAKTNVEVPNLRVTAGEVYEVRAAGSYRVHGVQADARGLASGQGQPFRDEPFGSAPLGAGTVRMGHHGLIEGHLVAPCARFVSHYDGVAGVGINDAAPRDNSGDVKLEIVARSPTADEWRTGRTNGRCETNSAPVVADNSGWTTTAVSTFRSLLSTALSTQLAAEVQGVTHPSGKAPSLGQVSIASKGDTVTAHISVNWRGGFLGTPYVTTIVWDFNQQRHIQARVESDNAPTRVAAANAAQLDKWFETQLYRAVAIATQQIRP